MSGIPQSVPGLISWLLVVEASSTHRYVSEDVQILDHGSPISCAHGLASDEVPEQVGRSEGSVTLAFYLPDSVTNGQVPLHDFLACLRVGTAELSLVASYGGVVKLEDRIVLRYGQIEDVEYDHKDGSLSITLIGNDLDDVGDLCPVRATVEERTWPLHPEDSRGKRYPFVYGAPGSYQFSSVTDSDLTTTFEYTDSGWPTPLHLVRTNITHSSGATPAIPVDVETLTIVLNPGLPDPITEEIPTYPRFLLVCDGWTDTETAQLWSAHEETGTGWVTSPATLVKAYDGLGRQVTLADISAANQTYRKAGKWFIGWIDGACRPGNLGDLVLDVLKRATCKIDWSSVRMAAQYLRRYTLGGFCDKSISPTSWVKNRLQPLGVVPRWSTEGFGLVVLDPGWTGPKLSKYVVGAGTEINGSLRLVPPKVDLVEVAWTGQGTAETASRRVRSAVRRLLDGSARGPGLRDDRLVELELPEVWDSGSAIAAGELAMRLEAGHHEVEVQVDNRTNWWVRAGDTVSLVWEDLGYDESDRWLVVGTQHTTAELKSLVLRRYDEVRTKATATIESSTLEDA